MTSSRSRHAASAARKSLELGFAAPQVIAHRVSRMWLAGPVVSERDRKEFAGMVSEKQLAFSRSWIGWWQQMFKAQMEVMTWGWRHWGSLSHAAITPLHAKATHNARRLSRTPLLARRRR